MTTDNYEGIIVIYTKKNLNKQENVLLKKESLNIYTSRIDLLIKTLYNLVLNFLILVDIKYPVYILCENYTENDKVYIKKLFDNITIIFEDIYPCLPDFLEKDVVLKNIENKPVAHWRNIGYRHMCKFFSCDIFTHPVISKFKYYMRIDDDSIIGTPLINIFKYMQQYNIDYVYRVYQKKDCHVCNEGMIDFFKSLGCYYNYNTDITPFNNFHIIRIGALKNKPILTNPKLNNTLISNIYNKRWGDAPIHGAYIKMYNLHAICTETEDKTPIGKYLSFVYTKWGKKFEKGKYTITY